MFCRGGHGELTTKTWLDSTEKQKRRINLKFIRARQMDIHMDIQTDRHSQRQKIIDF